MLCAVCNSWRRRQGPMTPGWQFFRPWPSIRPSPAETAAQPRRTHSPAPRAVRPARHPHWDCPGERARQARSKRVSGRGSNNPPEAAAGLQPLRFAAAVLDAGRRSAVNAAIWGGFGSSKSGPTQDPSPKQQARPRPSPSRPQPSARPLHMFWFWPWSPLLHADSSVDGMSALR